MVDWAAGLAEYKKNKESDIDWESGLAEYKKTKGAVLSEYKPAPPRENIAVEGEAPFKVHAMAAASENPEQVISSYAQHRFPTLPIEEAKKRYYMRDGEVWYIDNDGYERKEDRETGLKAAIEQFDPTKIKAKQLGARALLEAPPAIAAAGTQLATGQPILAAGAAGAARAVETGIAQLLAEREPQYSEMLKAGGIESVSAILGDFIAKKGIKAFDKIRNAATTGTEKTIKRAIGEEIPGMKLPESQKAIQEIARVAEENNIPLDLAQLLQSQKAANLQKSILQEGGAGAEILKEQGRETAEATYGALTGQLRDIAPETASRYGAGRELAETAGAARQELVDVRGRGAGELYEKAFKEQAPVETTPVIKSIDLAMENDVARGGKTQSALNKIRGMLVQNAPENNPTVKEIDRLLSLQEGPTQVASDLMAVRDKLTKGAGIVEDRLKKLDSAKKEIGSILQEGKIPPEQEVYLTRVIDDLTTQMDKENPVYQEARKKFAELSEPVDAFDKTILDVVRKLEGDNVIKAPRRIFSSDFSDPETIKTAKRFIQKQNPRVWDSAVRVFMEQELDKIGDVISGRGIAEAYRKKVWKPQMKARLKAALEPEKFKRLDDFMGLVKNLSISIDANSDTAMKQLTAQERKRMAGGKAAGALRKAGRLTDLLKGNLKELASTLEEARDPEFSRRLALAFTAKDKDIIRAVNRLKTVNPKTQKYLRSFATLVSTITGRAGYQKSQTDQYGSKEDVIRYLEGPE